MTRNTTTQINQSAEVPGVAQAMNLMTHAVEQANAKVAVPPPPIFDNSSSMYRISEFFELFEPYATTVYGPKSRSWILALQPFVAGDVKAALLAIGPMHATYDGIKQRLIDPYSAGNASILSPHAQFITAVRNQGESLQVFRFRLERLAVEAFGKQNNKELIITKFLINLKPEIKNHVEAYILSQENVSLDVVVTLAATLGRNTTLATGYDPTNYIAATEQVALVNSSQFPQKCTLCQRRGHKESNCWFKGKTCYSCHKTGHFAKDCPESTVIQQNRRRRGEGNYGRTLQGNPVRCAFCKEHGHKMAHCPQFLGMLRKCCWCGDQSQESFQCSKNPARGMDSAGDVSDINMLMQNRLSHSSGKAYFVKVEIADVSRRYGGQWRIQALN